MHRGLAAAINLGAGSPFPILSLAGTPSLPHVLDSTQCLALCSPCQGLGAQDRRESSQALPSSPERGGTALPIPLVATIFHPRGHWTQTRPVPRDNWGRGAQAGHLLLGRLGAAGMGPCPPAYTPTPAPPSRAPGSGSEWLLRTQTATPLRRPGFNLALWFCPWSPLRAHHAERGTFF